MASKVNTYLTVGDGSDFGTFEIEVHDGVAIFIESTHDERYCLNITLSDWEKIKAFIDEQIKNN